MAISKKLLKLLEDNKIKYEVLEHRKVYTALDCAETQHMKPQEIVKTMVMKADTNYFLALLPANKNTDKVKLKKAINVWIKKLNNLKATEDEQALAKIFKKVAKKIDFAKEAWMKKNMLGKVGATPPFGSLVKLPVFMDSSLYKAVNLIVNAGEYTESIKLKTKSFEKLEQPIKAVFAVKK